jgi:hypothetical protein
MDRRSFLLTSLLPVVAAKRGLLGIPGQRLRDYWGDRILIMKARSIGMSTLVHNRMVAAQKRMSLRLAQDIWHGY